MRELYIDILAKYTEIEADILENMQDVFNRQIYYTTKYRGDRLNDVNVGVFLGDGNIPTVQIFIRNKTGCIRTQFTFTRDSREITNKLILNFNQHGK